MVSADAQIESWLKLILDIGEDPLGVTHTHTHTFIHTYMVKGLGFFKECLKGLSFRSGLISETVLLNT